MHLTKPLEAEVVGWQFDLMGYDEMLHARVKQHVLDIQESYKLFMLGATVEQVKLYPPIRYSTSKDYPGLFNVFLWSFGEYTSPIEAFIGVETLKDCTGVPQFFELLHDTFNLLNEESRRAGGFRLRMVPSRSLKDVAEEVAQQREAYLLKTQRQKELQIGTPPGGNANAPQTPVLGESPQIRDRVTPDLAEHKHIRSFQEMNQDNQFYSESPYQFDRRRVANDHSDIVQPCLQHFYERNCDGNCGCSHNAEDMYNLRDQILSEYANSPWVSPDWLASTASKLKQGVIADATRFDSLHQIWGDRPKSGWWAKSGRKRPFPGCLKGYLTGVPEYSHSFSTLLRYILEVV